MKLLQSQRILDFQFSSNLHLVVVGEGFASQRMKKNYGRNTKWLPPNQRRRLARLPFMLKNALKASVILNINLFAILMATVDTYLNANALCKGDTRSSSK